MRYPIEMKMALQLPWPAKISVLIFLAALAVLLSSCKGDIASDASDSDANGYICSQCSTRFYTDRALFAERCPNCKQLEIVKLVGFVCSKDKHMTLASARSQSVECEKCKAPVNSIKLPRAKEFDQRGIKKASKAEVLVSRP